MSARYVKQPVGAHYGLGAWLSRSDRHPALSEVCHLLGSGMFLANIALIGQVYHLSSRPPNAILLWLAGIIPRAIADLFEMIEQCT